MAFSPEIIKKVKDEFETSRKKAQESADARKAELHAVSPEIRSIDELLASTGLRVYGAAMKGEDVNTQIESMRSENKVLRDLRADLLVKLGYPADYSDVKYRCAKCDGTGYIELMPCDCFKKALVKEAFLSSGLGSVLTEQSFDNFDLGFYSDAAQGNGLSPRKRMGYILSEMKKYAENFAKVQKSANLCFFGGTGLGKTHISTAIARRIIEDGMNVVYDTAQNIMQAHETKTFTSNKSGDTDKYLECDLLIIDDLGAEFKNSFTVSVLYNILNSRITSGKAMIISTNFDSVADIAKIYDGRIYSRLLGEFRSFVFVGDDIRLKKSSGK